jgi:hypothetical protein
MRDVPFQQLMSAHVSSGMREWDFWCAAIRRGDGEMEREYVRIIGSQCSAPPILNAHMGCLLDA